MTSKVKFPIRLKLLLLMGGFVLFATGAYLILSIQLFKDDKTQLVYELNASTVKTLAAETESNLTKITDKIKLITQGHQDENWTRSVFESEPDLIAYTLYNQKSSESDWSVVTSVRNPEYLKIYGLSTSEIDKIRDQIPIPFNEVVKNKYWIVNGTLPGGAPIYTVGLNIEILSDGGSLGQYVAVVDLRLDRLLKLLVDRKIVTSYLIDSKGSVIAHPDVNLVKTHHSMSDIPIVQDALVSPVALKLKKFEWNGLHWLGAFSSVGVGGLTIVSQVEETQVFRATEKLIHKTIVFAILVITVSLLVSGWLARTFSEPLTKLMDATEKLSRWEFSNLVHVKTQDEIALLARSFNAMATDLQNQRRQLEANQEELERKVTERTQELEIQKNKLSESQDALLRTTRLASLGELAGAAAHEVLNPVNNMNIRVEKISKQVDSVDKPDFEMLNEIIQSWKTAFSEGGWKSLEAELNKPSQDQSKTLGEEDLENLSGIANDLGKRSLERSEDMKFLGKEIVRITRIINNMRSLSRVGGERSPLDIHLPLDETGLTLGDLLKKRNIDLVKDYSADSRDLFVVIGDKDELVQVFSNLIRNSIYAITKAEKRAGIIRIETKRNSNRIEVRISDNGTGISQDNLPFIFEPNFTTKSLEEGTGLGLSISRRLIRAFDGDIEVEKSFEGDGTTFLVWLPVTS